MKINEITRAEFNELAQFERGTLERLLDVPEVFIVKRYCDPFRILELRDMFFAEGQATEPAWYPCKMGCPDYHRLHDDYPKAHVKARMHAFYKHGWYARNSSLFDEFAEIFKLKCLLGGFEPDAFIRNEPIDGQIARVICHHYPKGGGYQAEHIDPVAPWAKIQTLIQGSRYGEDYEAGGLDAHASIDDEVMHIDPYTEPGDLMVLSPGIPHGVAPVDPTEEYGWRNNDGRWMIMPIILTSDEHDGVRPRHAG